jgi:hypothetical protein
MVVNVQVNGSYVPDNSALIKYMSLAKSFWNFKPIYPGAVILTGGSSWPPVSKL